MEAICDLGILPHLRVLLLTGNGLTSLPPNLAVTEQEASVTSLTSKRYILRFPALETLMLDDNKLSHPSCFASLAGLRSRFSSEMGLETGLEAGEVPGKGPNPGCSPSCGCLRPQMTNRIIPCCP